jgi:mono/diheme cytochrome c family protein
MMIKKILKWAGISLLAIMCTAATGFLGIRYDIQRRATRQYVFEADQLTVPKDSAAIEKGRHLSIIRGCQDCHGDNLGGKLIIDNGPVGRLAASNLTRGQGGLPAEYSEKDWVMALRHGVDQSGQPLIFMPSHETTLLSEEDLASVIAYCMSVPAVDNTVPETNLGPMAYVMSYFDKMPLLSVEKIDHNKPMVLKADTSGGPEQGKYLAVSCSGCHRSDFKGGEPIAPGLPPVPDITKTGHVGRWTEEQFVRTLRTGHTPEGHQLKNDEMPWQMTARYDDKELVSLYRFFKSI